MDVISAKKLEFDRIVERLMDRCGSSIGRAMAASIEPLTDIDLIREESGRTTEAVRFIETYGPMWDMGIIGDIDDILYKLESGRVLEPVELGHMRDVLDLSGKIKGSKVDAGEFPSITELRGSVFAGSGIAGKIAASIDAKAGTVLDSASPTLQKARKSIRNLEKAIPDNLRKMMNGADLTNMVQDRVVTMRNGRFVIPLKTDFAQSGKWVLQDRSSSGSTSFVEPLDTVEENNRLTRERLVEKSEVLRILRELTSALVEKLPEISESLDALGEIDCLLARGRLSREWSCVEPEFDDLGHINIKSGRHPLLGSKAVPVDLNLGGGVKCLILTGPNAGGKTVTLKLIGMFHLMAQCGLHVPAAHGTRLGVFQDICAVIGDEQNIELDLSTFSSHLKGIREIMETADGGSLALIDEICSGTDPEEGTALACGILKELMDRGSTVITTSHHSGLKTFASVTDGAENACMVFDEKEKVPAFRVEIGVPGKSYALEMAERAGLGGRLIESAKEYLSSQSLMTERLLAELEEMKSFIQIERSTISREKEEIEKTRSEAQKKVDEAKLEKEKMILKALNEAEKIVAETRNKCRELIKDARNAIPLPKEAAIKGEIKEIGKKIQKKKIVRQPARRPVEVKNLKPGMIVALKGSGETVRFLEGPDRRGKVKALLGEITITTDLRDLVECEGGGGGAEVKKQPEKRDYSKYIADAKGKVKSTIDLHGMRVQEAYDTLDAELEVLTMAGAKDVRIMHGIGTGTLMKAVHEYLEKSPFVTRHEICGLDEGGIGATRAYLK